MGGSLSSDGSGRGARLSPRRVGVSGWPAWRRRSPAGAAAARLLATWGHSVQLLTKTVDRSRSLGESLPPSCRKLFDLLGATAAIDAAGFLASSGNTVWWGDEITRTAGFADGATGLQVTRHDLDALLLQLAAQAGAHA